MSRLARRMGMMLLAAAPALALAPTVAHAAVASAPPGAAAAADAGAPSGADALAAVGAAPGGSWLDAPTPATAPALGRGVQALGMAAVLLGGTLWAMRQLRRAQGPRLGARGGRIDLLALRSLGGKQRLALVEVCGERLLLAATDAEVTLLSHLPAPLQEADAEAQAQEEVHDAPAPIVAQPEAERMRPPLAVRPARDDAEPSSGMAGAAVAARAPGEAAPPAPTVEQLEASLALQDGHPHLDEAPHPQAGPPHLSGDLAGLTAWHRQAMLPELRP